MLFLVALILIGSVSIVSAQTSWWRTYGGTGYDEGCSVQQTSDGGYVMAGWTESFGVGTPDTANVYLIKTNTSGDTLWTRTYGGRDDDWGYSVRQTVDSGYIIAGRTASFGAGNMDVYLIKTDASGYALWTRTYGGTSYDYGFPVQQTSDGGYIIAGHTYSFGTGTPDHPNVYLIKANASGETLWTKTYGGTNYDEGYSVRQTVDGGYVIAGYTYSFAAGSNDVYLIKTDASGDTLWTKTYGGTNNDVGYSVQQTADGGYIIAGHAASFGAEDADVYLIKANASGDTAWTRTHGGTGDEWGYSVRQTADGGYVIAGRTLSFAPEYWDAYLIKTDKNGRVGVAEESPKPQVMRNRLGPTVLSGASGVRQLTSCVAFDAMGRRVLHLKPGIYFVKEPKAQAQAPAVQKVLLVR